MHCHKRNNYMDFNSDSYENNDKHQGYKNIKFLQNLPAKHKQLLRCTIVDVNKVNTMVIIEIHWIIYILQFSG